MAGKVNRSNGEESNRVASEGDSAHFGDRCYEICVKGQLGSQWSEWLEGLEVSLVESGEMILTGPIVDQAALMGILNKLNRLNLKILSLNEVEKKELKERQNE